MADSFSASSVDSGDERDTVESGDGSVSGKVTLLDQFLDKHVSVNESVTEAAYQEADGEELSVEQLSDAAAECEQKDGWFEALYCGILLYEYKLFMHS